MAAIVTWRGVVTLTLSIMIATTVTNLSDVLAEFHGIPMVGKLLGVPFLIAVGLAATIGGQGFRVNHTALAIVLAYLAVTTLSVVFARYPQIAIDQLIDLVRDLLIAVLVMMVVREPGTMRWALRSFYIPLSVLALACILQSSTGDFGSDQTGFLQAEIGNVAGFVDTYRVQGPFADPNSFGRVLLAAVPLVLADILVPNRSSLWRLFGIVAMTALIGGLLLTYSRGAILGLVVMGVLLIWWFRRLWPVLSLSAVAVVAIVLVFAPTSYLDRIARVPIAVAEADDTMSTGDESIVNRLDEMALALHMFAESPVVGMGFGNYAALFQKYSLDHHALPRQEDREAHSLPLEVAAETGILGLLAFAAVLSTALFDTLLADRRDDEILWLARAVGLGILGYFAASLVLHDDYPRIAWLLIAFGLARVGYATSSPQSAPLRRVASEA